MKPSTRYALLLFAGIADMAIGIYAFALVITQIITGLESLWVIVLGVLTALTGAFLIYRILPVVLRIRRDEPVPTLIDERTRQIIHRAASNAFAFLIIVLIVMVSVTMALSKWGYILAWNAFVTALLIIWMSYMVILQIKTKTTSLWLDLPTKELHRKEIRRSTLVICIKWHLHGARIRL